MKKEIQTPLTDELAQQVADEVARQHHELTNRNWAQIQDTMNGDEDGEVKLTFATTITNRRAEDGNQASKDSRIVTTMSFSLGKKSDKIESAFPDPAQMELPVDPTGPK